MQIGYFGLLPEPDKRSARMSRGASPRRARTKIALDTVNPPAAAELLWPILPHVDIFCPSRTEAAALTGETDPTKMAAVFRKQMPRTALVGIKLDADGCYLDDGQ